MFSNLDSSLTYFVLKTDQSMLEIVKINSCNSCDYEATVDNTNYFLTESAQG